MSLGPDYFEELYAANPDPWDFSTSAYESEKYTDTLAALGDRHFVNALEVGCSIGVLTHRLAAHCQALTALDVSPTALAAAELRCRNLTHVRFARSELPRRAPAENYDLIVLSEVLYYLTARDQALMIDELLRVARPSCLFVLVHWTPFVASYPQTGEAVHDALISDARFKPLHGHRRATYRLDVLQRATQP